MPGVLTVSGLPLRAAATEKRGRALFYILYLTHPPSIFLASPQEENEAKIHFDDESHIRVLHPDKFNHTQELAEQCTSFVESRCWGSPSPLF